MHDIVLLMAPLLVKTNSKFTKFANLDLFMALWSFFKIKFRLENSENHFPSFNDEITCK